MRPKGCAKKPTVLILGSSVAAGSAASPGCSYADLLEAALKERHGDGYQVLNAGVGGASVGVTLHYAESVGSAELKPDAVLIALGLANEGLPWAQSVGEGRKVCERFTEGLRAIAAAVVRRWGRVSILFGGVYPFGLSEGGPGYADWQRRQLLAVDAEMRAWEEPVIPFLDFAGSRETCRWHPGVGADMGHPNNLGHLRMFEAIDLALFPGEASADRDAAPPRSLLARAEVPDVRRLWDYYALGAIT